MATDARPFNPTERSGETCPCGCGSTIADHRRDLSGALPADAYASAELYVDRIVETTVLQSIMPDAMLRRSFLKAVGASTALAAIAQAFPLDATKAIAREAASLEKPKLNVGFVPITCTVPIFLPMRWRNTRRKVCR